MGLLLTVINCNLLLLFFFTGLLKEAIYLGYREMALMNVIIYCGAIFVSFLFCFTSQIVYKMKKFKNGFLFWILCV